MNSAGNIRAALSVTGLLPGMGKPTEVLWPSEARAVGEFWNLLPRDHETGTGKDLQVVIETGIAGDKAVRPRVIDSYFW
jgi:hypothetical protein